jgi:hypothetical protein
LPIYPNSLEPGHGHAKPESEASNKPTDNNLIKTTTSVITTKPKIPTTSTSTTTTTARRPYSSSSSSSSNNNDNNNNVNDNTNITPNPTFETTSAMFITFPPFQTTIFPNNNNGSNNNNDDDGNSGGGMENNNNQSFNQSLTEFPLGNMTLPNFNPVTLFPFTLYLNSEYDEE